MSSSTLYKVEPPKGGKDPQEDEVYTTTELAGVFANLKDSMGRFRTQSLFKEYEHKSYPAYFTLKDYDVDKFISFKRKYLEISDPTEYQVAMQLLGSWKHWQILSETTWFKPHLETWRKELQVKMESERYREMVSIKDNSEPNSAQAAQATKWLAERYTKAPKRGRPSKDEVKAHLRQQAEDIATIEDDAKALGLK